MERIRTFSEAQAKDREPLQDRCGILGAIGSHEFMYLTTGVDGLSKLETRGHDAAGGIGLNSDGEVAFSHVEGGRVRKVFTDDILAQHRDTPAGLWIFQTRYGTNGDLFDSPALSAQPVRRIHKQTGMPLVVAHNGEFWTDNNDRSGLVSDSIVFVERLAQSTGNDWPERIINTLKKESGTYSLIIGVPGEMILVRDPEETRPLLYGKYWHEGIGDNIWVAASETNALNKMGVSEVIEVLGGELVRFVPDHQSETIQALPRKTSKICLFENVYTHHGNSKAHLPRTTSIEVGRAPSVGEVRRRSGEIMAIEAPLTADEVDFVVGIPGTAISGGKGFAHAFNLPYLQVVKDRDPHDNLRAFMTPDIHSIYGEVLKGFKFDVETLRGKRVVVVEDSVVRFNVLRAVIGFLQNECETQEIHVRILCPPIEEICNRGGANTRDKSELLAGRMKIKLGENISDELLIESIKNEMGVHSLAYLSLEGLKEAQTSNPNDERFCTDCMTSTKSPVLRGNVYSRA